MKTKVIATPCMGVATPLSAHAEYRDLEQGVYMGDAVAEAVMHSVDKAIDAGIDVDDPNFLVIVAWQ